MGGTARVTVTLPSELVEGIDHFETNRSRFVAETVAHELARRRREELKRSLANPHPEALELAEAGLGAWAATLPAEESDRVDMGAGAAVRWVEGLGWVAERA
jgi:post-segregation antitoxin (ccd killing protein)